MGIDKSKLPEKAAWENLLRKEFEKTKRAKNFFYLEWFLDDELIGHSNINDITFGESAKVHLHIWAENLRQKGLGQFFFKESISMFCDAFELKQLICEPSAKNPAPNRVFKRLGIKPEKEYLTTPGWINFEQLVKRYEISEKI